MAKTQGRKKLIVIIAILVVVLVAGGVAFGKLRTNTNTPSGETTLPADASKDTVVEPADEDSTPTEKPAETVDPNTLASIAIDPLGITVYYSKGTPGFDFSIKKTTDRTEYVDFTATNLVGAKCTDDEGLFASIIKNPPTSEAQTTISQTVKVGADTYGLSLAGQGCTDDVALLETYQSGFKAGFSSLSAL